ncbi:MAG: protein kinase [Lachnospiraceae bacterium]
MLDIQHLCPGCMQTKPDSATVCPHCGYTADMPVSENALPVFTILQGKYLVGAPLGKGGFGITYIAMDLQTETVVAIKEYFPADFACRAADTETVLPVDEKQSLYFRTGMKSFTREGELLHRLSDIPGIVQFLDMLYCNNTAYLVMSYIPGISLKKQMKKQEKPFTEREALTMMHPILSALQTMHQKHILHRDISPENLMYGSDHTLTLIDFGAAREFSTDDDENLTVILKRGYAPEEQYHSGSRQGAWTDVYAVCAVLYHMLTGILPQEADKRAENDQLTPLSRLPQISVRPSVCQAIEKGLQVDALERYASMKALMKDLYADSAYAEGKTVPEDNATTSPTTESVDSDGSSAETSGNISDGSTEPPAKQPDSHTETQISSDKNTSHRSFLRVAGYIVLAVFGLFLGRSIVDFILSGNQQSSGQQAASVPYSSSSGLQETTAISYINSDGLSETTAVTDEPQASPDSAVVVEMSGGSVLDYFTSLTEAIQFAQQYSGSDLNIRLLKDLTEDICIPAGLEISIDFDNHTLCNVSDHTIINHGDLTLREGTLDNLTNEKAALCNASDGVAYLAFMEVTRSAENGVANQEADNLNTYYTIDNQGSLSVYDSTVRNSGSYSSTIHNGTKGAAFTGNFYADITFTGITTLVEGGRFGLKNEADGCAVIDESAIFHDSSDSLIYTKGSLTVNGAFFNNAPCGIKVAGGHYEYADVTFETDKDIENE